MFVSETQLIVRYAETDQMGIVHHSNYPIWFEAGRTDFIRELGMPYSAIEEEGILLPLIRLECHYKGFAKYEDEIKVKTSIKKLTYTRIIFYYEIYKNNEEKPITTGETEHAWTTRNLKPLNLKKHSSHIYDLLSGALQDN
ncbi:MAG TPA: acyl-CoA thioesterase [Clostridiaceae bacterium]|nr:acyl-CoA thioesterase [Clostridiaceae bacterium]